MGLDAFPAILWFFLPFAVFGTKQKIDELILINKKTIVLLDSINAEIIKLREVTRSTVNHEQS